MSSATIVVGERYGEELVVSVFDLEHRLIAEDWMLCDPFHPATKTAVERLYRVTGCDVNDLRREVWREWIEMVASGAGKGGAR
jgi:hypothetical protein